MDPLRREVMAPREPVGLLGPLFVLGSTLALALSMAAIAFAPQGHRHHCGRRIERVTPMVRSRVPAPPPPQCGAPIYRANPDGAVDVTYEVCATVAR